jgi:hypothetical protein
LSCGGPPQGTKRKTTSDLTKGRRESELRGKDRVETSDGEKRKKRQLPGVAKKEVRESAGGGDGGTRLGDINGTKRISAPPSTGTPVDQTPCARRRRGTRLLPHRYFVEAFSGGSRAARQRRRRAERLPCCPSTGRLDVARHQQDRGGERISDAARRSPGQERARNGEQGGMPIADQQREKRLVADGSGFGSPSHTAGAKRQSDRTSCKCDGRRRSDRGQSITARRRRRPQGARRSCHSSSRRERPPSIFFLCLPHVFEEGSEIKVQRPSDRRLQRQPSQPRNGPVRDARLLQPPMRPSSTARSLTQRRHAPCNLAPARTSCAGRPGRLIQPSAVVLRPAADLPLPTGCQKIQKL